MYSFFPFKLREKCHIQFQFEWSLGYDNSYLEKNAIKYHSPRDFYFPLVCCKRLITINVVIWLAEETAWKTREQVPDADKCIHYRDDSSGVKL